MLRSEQLSRGMDSWRATVLLYICLKSASAITLRSVKISAHQELSMCVAGSLRKQRFICLRSSHSRDRVVCSRGTGRLVVGRQESIRYGYSLPSALRRACGRTPRPCHAYSRIDCPHGTNSCFRCRVIIECRSEVGRDSPGDGGTSLPQAWGQVPRDRACARSTSSAPMFALVQYEESKSV
jgi:hypothetical protein